jgi:hypothetical protein
LLKVAIVATTSCSLKKRVCRWSNRVYNICLPPDTTLYIYFLVNVHIRLSLLWLLLIAAILAQSSTYIITMIRV